MTDSIILPPNSKSIPLTQGKFAIVDDAWYEMLSSVKWYNLRGYAYRNNWKGTSDLMHRVIMDAPKDKQVDHINGDKFDNRVINLRLVSNQENQMNRKLGWGVSSYVGVCYDKARQTWRATITINSRHVNIGYYPSEEEAKNAYLIANKVYWAIKNTKSVG